MCETLNIYKYQKEKGFEYINKKLKIVVYTIAVMNQKETIHQ